MCSSDLSVFVVVVYRSLSLLYRFTRFSPGLFVTREENSGGCSFLLCDRADQGCRMLGPLRVCFTVNVCVCVCVGDDFLPLQLESLPLR